jgi:hypothetical protein
MVPLGMIATARSPPAGTGRRLVYKYARVGHRLAARGQRRRILILDSPGPRPSIWSRPRPRADRVSTARCLLSADHFAGVELEPAATALHRKLNRALICCSSALQVLWRQSHGGGGGRAGGRQHPLALHHCGLCTRDTAAPPRAHVANQYRAEKSVAPPNLLDKMPVRSFCPIALSIVGAVITI